MGRRAGYDVAIVGASLAGCAAARLYGLAGARVALAERSPNAGAFKVVCTHQIQSSASPTIERLGLGPLLEGAGAARTRPAAWTPYGGWLRFPADVPRAHSLSRKRLDPLIRELATGTGGVDFLPGRTAVGLGREDGGLAHVVLEDSAGRRERISARLVVAADGRDSTVARLAGVRARVTPHDRFVYFAFWQGVRTQTDEARVWFLEPDGAAVFPSEQGSTLIAVMPHKARLSDFRRDRESAYEQVIRSLPDGPGIDGAERVSDLIGKLEMPNKLRPAAQPGLAFIGDAALATDPVFGVGCGWALQSAEWLVDRTAPALLDGAGLDRALGRYRRTFLRRLLPHHLQIASYSTGRPMRPDERLFFAAASHDERVGAAIEEYATRRRSPARLLDPRLLPPLLRGLTTGPQARRRHFRTEARRGTR